MENKKNIAIIGGTGMLGLPVAMELINAGFNVTALVRNKAKAERLLPKAVNIIVVELHDKIGLNSALKGVDDVYLNLSVSPTEKKNGFHPEKEGLANVINAVKKNKIKRIGYLSSIISRDYKGIDWWVFDIKQEAINTIKKSGVSYSIFYPSSFMENLNNTFIRGNKINIVGKPLYKNWWISGEDYGRQVATSFEILKEGENREYTIQGTEALMMDEAVEIFVKHYKKQSLKIGKAPLGLLKFIGIFNPQLKYVSNILEVINNCNEKFDAQQSWEELGKPRLTVLEYTKGIGVPAKTI